MPLDESTIQLMPVPSLWPPAEDHAAALGTPSAQGSTLPALSALPARDTGTALPLGQGPLQPTQFAILLSETLAGVRPAQQLTPWLSQRATLHLHRLMPMFRIGHQPRVLRILTTRPDPDVIEMTVIAAFGPRPRALAIRLEHQPQQARWQCTDIESA
jgi:hypothetical protein